MVVRIQTDVSQMDNQIWLSLRELQNEVLRVGDHVWISANPPIEILLPVTWANGYLAFLFGLKAGESTNVTVDLWKKGATASVNLANAVTVSNAGIGAAVEILYLDTFKAEADWLWIEFNYTGGKKKPCALAWIGSRR